MTYKQDIDWIDHDFRPAPPGWRLVYLTNLAGTIPYIVDMPGWMVQQRRGMDDRRVVAANIDPAGQLYPAGEGEVGPTPTYEAEQFWGVLSPTDPAPTHKAAVTVLRERQARRQAVTLDRLYLTVTCPTCWAGPGTPCTIRRGPPDRTTHLARQDRAVLVRQDRAVRAEQRHTDRQPVGGGS